MKLLFSIVPLIAICAGGAAAAPRTDIEPPPPALLPASPADAVDGGTEAPADAGPPPGESVLSVPPPAMWELMPGALLESHNNNLQVARRYALLILDGR